MNAGTLQVLFQPSKLVLRVQVPLPAPWAALAQWKRSSLPTNRSSVRARHAAPNLMSTDSQDGKAMDCKSVNAGVRFSLRAPKL